MEEVKLMVFMSERLIFRELIWEDKDDLSLILQDDITMRYYNGKLSDAEVDDWLARQLQRYRDYGFGAWAVLRKDNQDLIGQCGLTMQGWKDQTLLEIGYLLRRDEWHKGYAIEAAKACKAYAFTQLDAKVVHSIIRDTNFPSKQVARRNGMREMDHWVKHYRGVDMPHTLFGIMRDGDADDELRALITF